MQTKQENLIKILAVDQDFMGSKYHRIYLPYKALQGKEVLIESVPHTIKVDFKKCPVTRYFLTEEEFQNYDVIVTNWVVENNLTEISEWMSKYNCHFINDIDDFYEVPSDHIDFKSNPHYQKVIPQTIISSVTTCSTDRLAAHLIPFNKNISVSYNALPIGTDQFIGKPDVERKDDKIAIYLLGSLSHYHDYMSAASVFKRLARESIIREKCKFVYAGYNEDNRYSREILKMLQNSHSKMTVESIPYKSVDMYMELFNECDIMICPLTENEFNYCKSAIRCLECGVKSVPIVGSPIYLEKECPTILPAISPKEHLETILDLIKDEKYKSIGQETNAAVMVLNDFEGRIENLRQVVEYLMNSKEEESPENLKIFSIVYNEHQHAEYEKYDNSHIRTIDQNSHYLEYNPILDIIDNKQFKEDDYVGIFSWKFGMKTGVSRKILYKMFEEVMNEGEFPDIVGLSPTFLKGNYLRFSNDSHPGFLAIFAQLCTRLGLELKEPTHIVYSNFFLAKYSVYKKYIEEVIKPAIKILEEEMVMEAFTNAQYKAGLSKEELEKYVGMDYYPMFPFLLERLLSVWLESHPEISFKQIL